jgi:hypothetical protein
MYLRSLVGSSHCKQRPALKRTHFTVVEF